MGYLLSLLPQSLLWVGCLGSIFMIGVPHGATDIYLLWSDSGKDIKKCLFLLLSYIGCVLLALAVWRTSPVGFWFLFFIAAIYHFGASDEHPEVLSSILPSPFSQLVWVFSRGLILVFAPAAFHADKIQNYLKQVTSIEFATSFIAVAPIFVGYGLVFYLIASLICLGRATPKVYRLLILKHLLSLLIMVMLFCVCDPLVGFCLYFCCHHSLTHLFRVMNKIAIRKSRLLIVGFLFTVPVIPIWIWGVSQMGGGLVPEKMVGACFVAVAALTFPHLLVVQKLHLKLKRHFQK